MSEEMKQPVEEQMEQDGQSVEETKTSEAVEESTENEMANDVNETEALKKKIAELESDLLEKENRYLRLYADFENSRRRAQLDRESGEKYRSQQLITNLLPAIDNFERAMEITPEHEQTKALLDGVAMVYRSIITALEQEGAEQIKAIGEEFDPNLHQAVMQVEDPEFESNIVVEELQKGYKLKDRTIRPSMVKVNK